MNYSNSRVRGYGLLGDLYLIIDNLNWILLKHTKISVSAMACFLDFPTRKHAIALTLILVCFRSIQFKLSNDQAKLSKQSITADAAIRIVLLTLQGCTATHT